MTRPAEDKRRGSFLDRAPFACGAGILAISATGIVLWWLGCAYHDRHRILVGSIGIAIGWVLMKPKASPPNPAPSPPEG